MPKKSLIERAAEALRLIEPLDSQGGEALPRLGVTSLRGFPPPERWHDWEVVHFEALQPHATDLRELPRRRCRRYLGHLNLDPIRM